MADPLDVLTANEAAAALPGGQTVDSTKLALINTAVSQMLDEMCGAIVVRTVTDEEHDGGATGIWLRQAPASANGATTITTVTEYASGTAQALTAETVSASTANDYQFNARTGELTRRSSWSPARFASQRVVVTYEAGRYATTADVAPKFKMAAKIILRHVWALEQGFASLSEDLVPFGAGFSVPRRALDFIIGELKGPVIA